MRVEERRRRGASRLAEGHGVPGLDGPEPETLDLDREVQRAEELEDVDRSTGGSAVKLGREIWEEGRGTRECTRTPAPRSGKGEEGLVGGGPPTGVNGPGPWADGRSVRVVRLDGLATGVLRIVEDLWAELADRFSQASQT